jgi:hypothetical protein
LLDFVQQRRHAARKSIQLYGRYFARVAAEGHRLVVFNVAGADLLPHGYALQFQTLNLNPRHGNAVVHLHAEARLGELLEDLVALFSTPP